MYGLNARWAINDGGTLYPVQSKNLTDLVVLDVFLEKFIPWKDAFENLFFFCFFMLLISLVASATLNFLRRQQIAIF